MQLSLTNILVIIPLFISPKTLASNYTLPLSLVSRQSINPCPPPVFLLYPDNWTPCGNGYIEPGCTCCNGGLVDCPTITSNCAVNAAGETFCCSNTSPSCSSGSSRADACAAEGKVYCGTSGCLPAGWACCPNNPNTGCPMTDHCCLYPDGSPACCYGSSEASGLSNTATQQNLPSSAAASTSVQLSSIGSGASTSILAVTTPKLSSTGSGASTSILAVITSKHSTSTAIPGPTSPVLKSSSTRVYVSRAERGSYYFSIQLATLFITICYVVLISIFI